MRNLCEDSGVSRRTLLIAAAGAAPLLVLTYRAEAAIKVSPDAAHYQSTPKEGQACAACYLFVAPNQCKFLAGEISPSGWCRLWKAKQD